MEEIYNMALQRLVIDGYGQLELNQVAFRRDGNIEAQCYLDTDDFGKENPCENGMLLAIDRVNRLVKLPEAGKDYPIALNYTTEHMYDERERGLKDFKLLPGEFLPRLGYLKTGELFTSNCLAYDSEEFADDDAVKAAAAAIKNTALYGGACENGAIKLSASKPEYGPVLKVVLKTTMPDGTYGLKFQVL